MGSDLVQAQQLLNLLQSLTQPIGQTGQKGIRTLSQDAHRVPVTEGSSVNLAEAQLNFTSQVDGAWTMNVVAVRFDYADEPRDVRIALVMGGIEYDLVDEPGYLGRSIVVTDHIKLNAGDQVRVYANGTTGGAHAEIRGELR